MKTRLGLRGSRGIMRSGSSLSPGRMLMAMNILLNSCDCQGGGEVDSPRREGWKR